jgi:hypothetical protein
LEVVLQVVGLNGSERWKAFTLRSSRSQMTRRAGPIEWPKLIGTRG